MFLRELFEAPTKTAAFALGRLNPATTGHELLVNAIKQAPGDSFLFLTDRAPKLPDNPLTAEEKLDWARKSFDGISVGLARTVLTAADRLYKMGYREVTFLEGEDKLYNLIKQYNGVEKEMHNYNFDKINYVQLQRNAEAADATGMSGTKLRGYVTSNDLEGFKKGVTTSAQPYAEDMFKKLQGIMGVDAVTENQQSVPVPQKIKVLKMPTPPAAPTGPDGINDAGVEVGTTEKGNRFVSTDSGKYFYDKAGKVLQWRPPAFVNGLEQIHDYRTNKITVKYNANMKVKDGGEVTAGTTSTYDMKGSLLSFDGVDVRSGGFGVQSNSKGTTFDYVFSDSLSVSASSPKTSDPKAKALYQKLAKQMQTGKGMSMAKGLQAMADAGAVLNFKYKGKPISQEQGLKIAAQGG